MFFCCCFCLFNKAVCTYTYICAPMCHTACTAKCLHMHSAHRVPAQVAPSHQSLYRLMSVAASSALQLLHGGAELLSVWPCRPTGRASGLETRRWCSSALAPPHLYE